MKAKDAHKTPQPFVKTTALRISVQTEGHRIAGFRVNGKPFPVAGNKVLDAWKRVERYVKTL